MRSLGKYIVATYEAAEAVEAVEDKEQANLDPNALLVVLQHS